MVNTKWSVTINAKPDEVWPLVGNLERHTEWSPKPYRMEWLSGEPNAVGSTFRSHGWLPQDKDHAMEGEITANEQPRRFALKSSDKSGTSTNTYTLEAQGDQTVVTKVMEPAPASGFGALALSAIWPILVRPGVQKGLDMLKAKVEGT